MNISNTIGLYLPRLSASRPAQFNNVLMTSNNFLANDYLK